MKTPPTTDESSSLKTQILFLALIENRRKSNIGFLAANLADNPMNYQTTMPTDEKSVEGKVEYLKSRSSLLVSTNVEDGHCFIETVAIEAPDEMEYACNYLPCLYKQSETSESLPCLSRTFNSAGMTVAGESRDDTGSKDSTIEGLSISESRQGEIAPPLMVVAASTSETEGEDEECARRQSMHGLTGELSQTDPFATRLGKTLSWRNVNMTLVRCIGCFI